MLCKVVVFLSLLVVLMVSSSLALTCYNCDGCATVDASTPTCDGTYCKLVVSPGVIQRSCATTGDGMCMIDGQAGPTFNCSCNTGDKCTDSACGCVDVSLGVTGTGDTTTSSNMEETTAAVAVITMGQWTGWCADCGGCGIQTREIFQNNILVGKESRPCPEVRCQRSVHGVTRKLRSWRRGRLIKRGRRCCYSWLANPNSPSYVGWRKLCRKVAGFY